MISYKNTKENGDNSSYICSVKKPPDLLSRFKLLLFLFFLFFFSNLSICFANFIIDIILKNAILKRNSST